MQGGQCAGVPEKGLCWISDNRSKSCYRLLNIYYSSASTLSIINRLFHLLCEVGMVTMLYFIKEETEA